MEVEARLSVGVKYSPDALGCPDGDGALLSDDLVAVGYLDDPPGARLNELEVGSPTLPHPIGLCGRVHLERDTRSFTTLVKMDPTVSFLDVDSDSQR